MSWRLAELIAHHVELGDAEADGGLDGAVGVVVLMEKIDGLGGDVFALRIGFVECEAVVVVDHVTRVGGGGGEVGELFPLLCAGIVGAGDGVGDGIRLRLGLGGGLVEELDDGLDDRAHGGLRFGVFAPVFEGIGVAFDAGGEQGGGLLHEHVRIGEIRQGEGDSRGDLLRDRLALRRRKSGVRIVELAEEQDRSQGIAAGGGNLVDVESAIEQRGKAAIGEVGDEGGHR